MKTLVSIILAFLFYSCSSPFGMNELGYESPCLPLEEAWARTAAFEYLGEDDTLDYWKSPREFERDGGGDCEDFAAYMIYLLGPQAKMAVLYLPNKGFHAVVAWGEQLLEPQHINCYWCGYGISWELGYWYVMRRATSTGTKNLN